MPPHILALPSSVSSASSLGIFNGNSVSVAMPGPRSSGITSTVPLLDPSPTTSPTPTDSPTPEPSPAPTVTVTQTVAPPGPSEVSGTVKLDAGQYLGLTSGIVLLLLFVVAVLVSQLRRP